RDSQGRGRSSSDPSNDYTCRLPKLMNVWRSCKTRGEPVVPPNHLPRHPRPGRRSLGRRHEMPHRYRSTPLLSLPPHRSGLKRLFRTTIAFALSARIGRDGA
ncbi:unnamed protein product, partial [Ectocarpus sp. 12 AP-2014]